MLDLNATTSFISVIGFALMLAGPLFYLWVTEKFKYKGAVNLWEKSDLGVTVGLLFDPKKSKLTYHYSFPKICMFYFFLLFSCLYTAKITTVFTGRVRRSKTNPALVTVQMFKTPKIGYVTFEPESAEVNVMCSWLKPMSIPDWSCYCSKYGENVPLIPNNKGIMNIMNSPDILK